MSKTLFERYASVIARHERIRAEPDRDLSRLRTAVFQTPVIKALGYEVVKVCDGCKDGQGRLLFFDIEAVVHNKYPVMIDLYPGNWNTGPNKKQQAILQDKQKWCTKVGYAYWIVKRLDIPTTRVTLEMEAMKLKL